MSEGDRYKECKGTSQKQFPVVNHHNTGKLKMPVNICFFTELATVSLLNLINAPNWLLILCSKFS